VLPVHSCQTYPYKICQEVTDFRKIWFECYVALPSIIPASELQERFDVGEILSGKSVWIPENVSPK
jgi:hypothetical protein